MAMLTLSDFNDQLSRRGKNSSAAQVLRRALDPENIEYMLNGSRFLCRQPAIAGADYPIGTCGNEAMARELKSWGENVIQQTRGGMSTVLRIFSIAEIMDWVCRGEYPASRRMAQNEVLACASGVIRDFDGASTFDSPGAGSPVRRASRASAVKKIAMRTAATKRNTVFTDSKKVAKPFRKRKK